MKRQKAWFATFMLLAGLLVSGTIAQTDPVTIEGMVNERAQIVTDDGEAYDLARTDLGKAVAELIGARVLVTGTVEETEKQKTITVDRYLVIDEEGRISMR
ncbi:MAG: hypothetical protein JW883_13325 [Deltaproteobacteria bacterium]|nr:hypothetical protein [Deltaproteobacteria bacterium]